MDKYLRKTLHDKTYNIIKDIKDIDKSNAYSIAKDVIQDLNNAIEGYINKTITSAMTPDQARDSLNMSRADIIQEIMVSIKLATGKDKLAFITELNRLEDNYKNSKQEHVFNVTLVNYASPEYQARQAERQQADRQTENHSSIPIETTQGHSTTPHPGNGDGAVNL